MEQNVETRVTTQAYFEEDAQTEALGVNSNNCNLQDSELSADSTSGDTNIEGNGWFSGIGADFRNIAHCLTDNVSPVVSGVASLVHRTAVAFANEIAQLERDGGLDNADRQNKSIENIGSLETASLVSSALFKNKKEKLVLPWEVRQDSSNVGSEKIAVYFTDNALMEDILGLSGDESTFLQPFMEEDDTDSLMGCNEHDRNSITTTNDNTISKPSFSSTFSLDEPRIDLIRRLMDIDKNLASVHSRFSGKFS